MRISSYLIAVALVVASGLEAKNGPPPPNEMAVDGHLVVTGAPVTHFVAKRHENRSYVYAHREGGTAILIDVTNPREARVLSEVKLPAGMLISDEASAMKVPADGTIRLVHFPQPSEAKVTRQFDRVTAVAKFAGGGYMVANHEGIWLLSQPFTPDTEDEERYLRKVLYGDSIY